MKFDYKNCLRMIMFLTFIAGLMWLAETWEVFCENLTHWSDRGALLLFSTAILILIVGAGFQTEGDQ